MTTSEPMFPSSPTTALSHGGIQHGHRCRLAVYPDQQLTIAILGNVSTLSPGGLVRKVTDACISHGVVAGVTETPPIDAIALAPEELARWCRLYQNPVTRWLVRVYTDGARLMLGWSGTGEEMIPDGMGQFRLGAADVKARFVSAPEGEARLEVVGSHREVETTLGPTICVPVGEAYPTPEQLNDYAGAYWSRELGAGREFSVRDTTLMVRGRKGDEHQPLEPTIVDGFFDRRFGFYAFSRDARNIVDGVDVTTDRIRALRFTKAR